MDRHFLEDYVYVIQGLLDWQSVSVVNDAEAIARTAVEKTVKLFWSPKGWRLSDENILPMPADQFNISDAQLPSPEIALLKLIHRLDMQGQPMLKPLLASMKQKIDARWLQNPVVFASHFSCLELVNMR